MQRCSIESPWGPILLAAEGEALTELSLRPDEVAAAPSGALLTEAARQLTAYFARDLRSFDLPLAPPGTAFQRRVWEELCRIPYGETISYGELARRIGKPGGTQAVGQANNRNPIAIVIPCHRVIGADGTLTGFGAGVDLKIELLRLEGAPCAAAAPTLF